MSLRDLEFLEEYRSGTNNVVRDFFRPALSQSIHYWRAAGYFSSSALNALGENLTAFIGRGGRIRLVTSVELTPEDRKAIEAGLERRTATEARLLALLQEFSSTLSPAGALLASLLASGRLELKIAVPTSGSGIFHEKVGVLLEEMDQGSYVSFSGSTNESRTAFHENYECIDVYPSWVEPRRASSKRKHFEALWAPGGHGVPGLEVIDFPEAARRQLLRIAEERLPGADTLGGQAASLWPHQVDAVTKFLTKRRGILEMATGTGKTRTALAILGRLLQDNEIDTCIIAADGTDLLEQWCNSVLEFLGSSGSRWSFLRHFGPYHERSEYQLKPKNRILVASREALPPVMRAIHNSQLTRVLLIHDEVHQLGSPSNVRDLEGTSEHVVFRLGLSATPERMYDAEGNAFIERHIGPVIKRYRLEDAIEDGILCEFDYVPLGYQITAEDRARLKGVFRQQAARKAAGNPMTETEVQIALSQVYKTSPGKLPVFASYFNANPEKLKRSMIFVATTEYGEQVLPLIHPHVPSFHTYYAGTEKEVLAGFATGEYECLITCHRLSQGIDVPSTSTVILLSSDNSQLETIRRIGRCLRIDKDNPSKRATVVDFIRDQDNPDQINSDQVRADWLSQVAKHRRRGKNASR